MLVCDCEDDSENYHFTKKKKNLTKNRCVDFLNSCLPLESLSVKPYMTWSGTFSLVFGYTVIQLVLMPELRLCCLCGHSAPIRAGSSPYSFPLCWRVFFPLQLRTRAELQYVGISKCQDCIMLTMCCNASLITLDSLTGKVLYSFYLRACIFRKLFKTVCKHCPF